MVRVAGLKRRIQAGDPTIGPDGLTAARDHAPRSPRASTSWSRAAPLLSRGASSRCSPPRASVLLRPKEVDDGAAALPRGLLPPHPAARADAARRRPRPPVPVPRQPVALPRGLARGPSTPSALPAHRALRAPHPEPGAAALRARCPTAPGQHAFMLLEDVIRLHLPRLYHGYEILSRHAIRVTRDADLDVLADGPSDLLASIEESLRERRIGRGGAPAVRRRPARATSWPTLVDELELDARGPLRGRRASPRSPICSSSTPRSTSRGSRTGRSPPHPVPAFERAPDVWSAIRAGDILVHHPYHSFDAVTRFVQRGGGRSRRCSPSR